MRGSFGPLLFKLVNTPSSFDIQQTTKFAQHPRIGQKAVLQWTGHELDTLKMTWRFDGQNTDPERKVSTLQQIMLAHEPHPLIMITVVGNTIAGLPYSGLGVFENLYVLESIKSKPRRFDPSGRIWVVDCDVQLIEFVPDGPGLDLKTGLGGIFGAIKSVF